MSMYSIYENEVSRIIELRSRKFKATLIQGRKINERYNSIFNNEIVIINDLISSLQREIDTLDINDLNNFFQKRTNEIIDNDKYIIDIELYDIYSKNTKCKNLNYEDIIVKIAQYSSLLETINTIKKGESFFERVYYNDLWDDYSFPIGDIDILDKIEYINNLLYPKNKSDSKKINTNITIRSVTFNLKEFALYMRTYYKLKNTNIGYKDIYNQVLTDYKDPFNYGDKPYNKTTFYEYLKDESPYETKNFTFENTYFKILSVVSKSESPDYFQYIKSQVLSA